MAAHARDVVRVPLHRLHALFRLVIPHLRAAGGAGGERRPRSAAARTARAAAAAAAEAAAGAAAGGGGAARAHLDGAVVGTGDEVGAVSSEKYSTQLTPFSWPSSVKWGCSVLSPTP